MSRQEGLGVKDLFIIDADGHVTEQEPTIQRYMRPEFRRDIPPRVDPWDRSQGGKLGKINEDPRVQLADLDVEGIDVQVIFPTNLSNNANPDTPRALEWARAYNDWLADFCKVNPTRLKGVATIALQDVNVAIAEIRRAVEELGHVAVMMPTNVMDRDIGHKDYWPFYEEVQRLGIPLCLHGGINAAERLSGRFDKFIGVHTVAFPFECMTSVVGLVYAGVPEAFPKMKIAVLEGCCGWLPFLMDRMDEEFEKQGWRDAPLLKRKPSEYLASEQFYYSIEIEESMVPYLIDRIGVGRLLWASDYPHWDTSWPHSVAHFWERKDIAEADKRKIFGDNPAGLYKIPIPAPA
jgi:predicted TIM-barrel fold metal-dependent hydrolase